jgi:ATP-dependent RNA helicase DHX29
LVLANSNLVQEELGSFSDISDVASDAEPGQLLSTYLRTRLDIYKLDPKAITSSTPRSKSGNPKGVVKQEKPMPRVRKLLQKMQKIESDILFDQRDADNQWALMKINWDKEAACQRKEEHLARKQAVSQEEETLINFNAQNHAAEVSRQADEAAANLFEGEDDDDIGLLGDLFTSLPQNETNETTGASQMVIQDSSGVKMMIQDFGKWTGVGPRRVLEEACRARYDTFKYLTSSC